jgi:hypothetical protein
MNRIASLFAAAALLLAASPAVAAQPASALDREAEAVAFRVEAAAAGVHTVQAELNAAWARARAVKAEQTALLGSTEATSEAGQTHAAALAEQLAEAKADIERLQANKAFVVAQRQDLQVQQKAILAARARAERSGASVLASR